MAVNLTNTTRSEIGVCRFVGASLAGGSCGEFANYAGQSQAKLIKILLYVTVHVSNFKK